MPRTPSSSSERDAVVQYRGPRSTPPAWVGLGRDIERTERDGTWKSSAPSFTQWVKQRAVTLGLSEVSLWRALSAVESYDALSLASAARGLVLPDLATVRSGMAAESVNLLERISRVAAPSVIDDLAERLIRGDAPRELLQRVWQKYRPLLDGATERGRGAAKVRPVPSKRAQAESSLQAAVVQALMGANRPWLGSSTPAAYTVFYDVSPEAAVPVDIVFHAVVATRRSASDRTATHGFEIAVYGGDPSRVYAKVIAMEPFVDFVWVATTGRSARYMMTELPVHVGIVTPAKEGLNVRRIAQAREARHAEALLRALILPVQATLNSESGRRRS